MDLLTLLLYIFIILLAANLVKIYQSSMCDNTEILFLRKKINELTQSTL